ncbi:G-protein coupled receptor 157 isoform X1 [Petromyzon marinus]|uniref:G-protein coupled receptor 157 isoform X1 n=1 Tax=Petromyzon marinus TaxID=7757 RepID=UPI003F706433
MNVSAATSGASPPFLPLVPPDETPVPPWCLAALCVACALSLLGSALLLGTYAAWPSLRTPARRLLASLAAADALTSVAYLYGALRQFHGDSWDCALQGAMSSVANSASFFLTVAIALHLHVTIVRGDLRMAERMHVWLHVVSWLVPLVSTSLAMALGHLGYDGSAVSVGWCWVRIDTSGALLWMLLTGKLWELLAYTALPVLYLHTTCHIRKVRKDLSEYRSLLHSGGPPARGAAGGPVTRGGVPAGGVPAGGGGPGGDGKLVLIPVVFVALRVWSTVRFFLALTDSPALHHPALVLLHGVGNSLQGAANCALFVFCTPPVRARLFSALCCRSRRPRRSRHLVEEISG